MSWVCCFLCNRGQENPAKLTSPTLSSTTALGDLAETLSANPESMKNPEFLKSLILRDKVYLDVSVGDQRKINLLINYTQTLSSQDQVFLLQDLKDLLILPGHDHDFFMGALRASGVTVDVMLIRMGWTQNPLSA